MTQDITPGRYRIPEQVVEVTGSFPNSVYIAYGAPGEVATLFSDFFLSLSPVREPDPIEVGQVWETAIGDLRCEVVGAPFTTACGTEVALRSNACGYLIKTESILRSNWTRIS